MANDSELKRKISSMLGTGVLATTLVVAPVSLDVNDFGATLSSAWASEGGSGDSGGNSGSGGSGDSGGGDSSGSDDNSGSGSSGESGSSGNSGKGGESGNSGKGKGSANSGEHGKKHRNRGRKGRGAPIPGRFGRVVKSKVKGLSIEITYSDGWKEIVQGGRYSLKDKKNKTVVQRPAKISDFTRLSKIARK